MQKKLLIIWIAAVICVIYKASFGADADANAEYLAAEEGIYYDFAEAKKILREIYRHHPFTFYCGCRIVTKNGIMKPELDSCGYETYTDPKRAKRIEWEHIVPASWLGNQLKCWQHGGRSNCRGLPDFDRAEGDMHNLVPAIGEINAERGALRYADFSAKDNHHGHCSFIVSHDNPRAVQPAREVRGFIARAYLYMHDTYRFRMSSRDQRLMEIWNEQYPVTSWECRRNELITTIQGKDNPYITDKCSKSIISDKNEN